MHGMIRPTTRRPDRREVSREAIAALEAEIGVSGIGPMMIDLGLWCIVSNPVGYRSNA
jgi:hypothetical protein